MANERRFAMAAAIGLRGDYDAAALRRLARSAEDAGMRSGRVGHVVLERPLHQRHRLVVHFQP